MTARIARGGKARSQPRGRPRPRGSAPSASPRRASNPGLLEWFGFAPGTGRRIAGWIMAGMAVAVIGGAVLAFRVPQLAGLALGEGVGGAGFTVRHVEMRGDQHVSRLDILNIAFDQPSMAMPLIDLEGTRARLLRLGWVKEARVHRRLPDTLVIDIVERRPAAIWQNGGRLSLIDSEGVLLEPVRIEAMPDLPLVIGPDANRHLALLDALLGATPHLRPQVAGATWVGGRRWDVRFQTGELLSLPEGEEAARRAITRFAMMDQQSQMLGRGFVRFDMRDPRRMTVRVSREPGSRVPALAPADPNQAAPAISRTI
jgi:cell division protein FtsQ